jgi:hypothetical protein
MTAVKDLTPSPVYLFDTPPHSKMISLVISKNSSKIFVLDVIIVSHIMSHPSYSCLCSYGRN